MKKACTVALSGGVDSAVTALLLKNIRMGKKPAQHKYDEILRPN